MLTLGLFGLASVGRVAGDAGDTFLDSANGAVSKRSCRRGLRIVGHVVDYRLVCKVVLEVFCVRLRR